jgi:hypothetical protein
VPASGGAVWLKAAGPEVRFEVGLYELLAQVVPERVLTPLGADAARGWLLLPDGGPTLGERLREQELIAALETALGQYGRLQRALAPHVAELLALGVGDMRPHSMPARFDEALAAVRGMVEPTQLERVAGLRASVVEWCERLAAGPVPASLDHNDLHAWNILGDGDAVRFYDWGDSVVAHPFASMLALGWVPDADAHLERLRDAYLEPFSDLASHAELVETLELACRVAKIARALTWQRAVRAFGSQPVDEQWRSAPAGWLLSLADESWLGP